MKLLCADLVNSDAVKHIHRALRKCLVHHGSVMLLCKHLLLVLLLWSFDRRKGVCGVPLNKATLVAVASVVDLRLLGMCDSCLKHQRGWLIDLLVWI